MASSGLKKWRSHVSKTMKQMKARGTYKKGDGLMKVLKEAKKTYKKRGGADEGAAGPAEPKPESPAPVSEGGRRRRTRRHARR